MYFLKPESFLVLQFYAVKKWLKLYRVPWCIKQYSTIIIQKIHSVCWYFTSFVSVVRCISLKFAC